MGLKMVTEKVKDTEIGFIPESWDYLSIKTIDPFKGTVQTGPFGSILHSYDYANEGVPLLLVKNIVEGRVVEEGIPRVNFEKANELKKFWLREGDIVFTRVGAVGRTLYVTKEYEGWMFSGQTLRVRINNPHVNNKFVEFYFRSPQYQSLSESTSLGSTRASINTSILANTNIPLPSKEEQDKIVEILLSIDQKIQINQKMNQTLEEIGQAIFKHWFVHFEFPNEEGKPYKSSGGEMVDSELGEIPKGWEVQSLDKIADYLNGLALQKFPQENDDYLPVIKIRELKQGVTSSTDKASAKIDSNYIIDNGDVIFSWSGSLEVVLWCGGKGALNQHLFKVTSEEYPKWFYYYWTKHHLKSFREIAADKTTTMGHIKRKDLSEALVIIPPEEELSKVDAIINPIIEFLINNEIGSCNLSKIRDSLLPKLMSGKIRVPLEGK